MSEPTVSESPTLSIPFLIPRSRSTWHLLERQIELDSDDSDDQGDGDDEYKKRRWNLPEKE